MSFLNKANFDEDMLNGSESDGELELTQKHNDKSGYQQNYNFGTGQNLHKRQVQSPMKQRTSETSVYQSQSVKNQSYTPKYGAQVGKNAENEQMYDPVVTDLLNKLEDGQAIRTDGNFHIDCKN